MTLSVTIKARKALFEGKSALPPSVDRSQSYFYVPRDEYGYIIYDELNQLSPTMMRSCVTQLLEALNVRPLSRSRAFPKADSASHPLTLLGGDDGEDAPTEDQLTALYGDDTEVGSARPVY